MVSFFRSFCWDGGGGAYHTNKDGPPWTVGPLEPPFDVENSQRFNSQLAT